MFPAASVLVEATLADAALLLQMMRSYYEYDGHPFVEQEARVGLTRLLKEPSLGKIWLVYQDDEAAGYLVACYGYSLEVAGRDAFIDEFFLHDEYRESGLGSIALAEAEVLLVGLGVRSLHLQVMPENEAAERFYRRAGFDDRGRIMLSKRLTPLE